MMAQSASSIVLVAALLINTISYCSAEHVYCVTPTATSFSSCPHSSTHNATLSEYAQEAETYFTSDTAIVFLPGDHVLDANIAVANVARLTMRGESSSGNIATVVRNGSVGFSFTNMVDFNIYFLAFTSYNRSWDYDGHPGGDSALLLNSTRNAKLVNCSFHDNLGNALTIRNTNITLAGNSEFTHNQCGCESFTERCELGCGITAVNSNLTFIGSTNFLRNSKIIQITENGVLTFNGTNNFINNSGSAIYTSHNNTVLATGYNVGGAIYALWNVTLTFNGTNNFINNSGSAIYTSHNTVLNFTGTSNFIGNHVTGYNVGGAIYALWNVTLTFNGTNNFINNSGSAIYTSHNTVLNFTGTSNFIGNHVTGYNVGGAIYALWNVTLTFNGTNNFINNSDSAIYTSHNTVLNFTGTSNFIGNHVTGYNGGGAIYTFWNAVLTFNGTSNFINNSANSASGGAISARTNISLSFTGTTNFSRNSAMRGGAISAIGNSTLTFNGANHFTNNGHTTNKFNINNGDSRGGAMYLGISSTFSIFPHTTVHWENNHANLGGAMSMMQTP